MVKVMPSEAAARAVASSPSGWQPACTPIGAIANAPYHVKLTPAGHGIACRAVDHGGVRGDATKTDHLIVHAAWMITTCEISDCTMSALRIEIHAPAAQLDAVAAVVGSLAAVASAPTS